MTAIHTMDDLRQLQAMPLSIKIRMTEQRIREWVREYGEEGVYVSFSGGKDSATFLDIIRNRMGYENIPAVFIDTGLEYPEIRDFVKTFDNVVWLKPEITFKAVIRKYGYPFISKRVCDSLFYTQKKIKDTGAKTEEEFLNLDINALDERMAMLSGRYNEWFKNRNGRSASKSGKETRSQKKYLFMAFGEYRFTSQCCDVMKKNPIKKYAKESGRVGITGQMASESNLRLDQWLKHGCNAFDLENPISNPLSFWTEQDVLKYIKENGVKIASVYGDIVPDYDDEQCDGQMSIEDLGLIPDRRRLKLTGCQRTGCMFCGFGCHLDDDQRFVMMQKTHPKQYEYIMKPVSEGGLGYKEIIDWLNEHGDLHIQY